MQQKKPLDDILTKIKHIHMIGIGGSGMCPLAEILHGQGYAITGSDVLEGDSLNRLKELGIKVFMEHSASNVQGSELVIYSAAISQENPEISEAARLGIPCFERSVLLGAITRKFSDTVGVSGTHGKTTVSSMITQILYMAGLDPTAVIGGKLPIIGSNGRAGKSDICVVESCEFVNTFLELSPDHVIITNIDNDHLDYFKTMENLVQSFKNFAALASKSITVNGDDPLAMDAATAANVPVQTFGMASGNDYYPENITFLPGIRAEFDIMRRGQKLGRISLNVPGEHNILNALAAAVVSLRLGATIESIREGLYNFKGAGRRFEVHGTVRDLLIVDDYAHHPTEVASTLKACKTIAEGQVWAVFQPFTFSRTELLLNEFAQALSIAEHTVLTPIMGSREVNTSGICSEQLAALVPGAVVVPDFAAVREYIFENALPGDLVITMGGGDIYKAAKLMMQE